MSVRDGSPRRALCAALAACVVLAPACAGRGGEDARAGKGSADSVPAARAAAASPGTNAAAAGAIGSRGGLPVMHAREMPWSPPPGPEPPVPTVSYPDLRTACDSAAAWVERATGTAPRREEGAAYEGRPGCMLRTEYREAEVSRPDSLFLRAGWVYLKYDQADRGGSSSYGLDSRDIYCRVSSTWPVSDDDEPEDSAADAGPSTLEVRCVERGPLDDLRVAIEHLGRSLDPVCQELAREAHARLFSTDVGDRSRRARFEAGHGTARFEPIEGAPPAKKYDPTVPGISYLTAVDRYALAGQVALNEARALKRADTATIVQRCTLFDRFPDNAG